MFKRIESAKSGEACALSVATIAYAFEVARLTDRLVNAILNREPVDRLLREVIVDLEAFDSSCQIGILSDPEGETITDDLARGRFDHAELRNGCLLLWSDKNE